MFKKILLLTCIFLPVCAQAAYMPQGGSGTNPPFVIPAISPTSTDNSVPLQTTLSSLVTEAQTNKTTFGIPAVQILSGSYKFLNGINYRPWIKLDMFGTTLFDFTNMSASGTAISNYNDDVPAGDFTNYINASNAGPFLNGSQGALLVNGPGKYTTSIGLAAGDLTAATVDAQFRETSITGTVFQNFGTCIFLRKFNTYMLNFDYGGTTAQCGKHISTDSGSSSNSGERMSFKNWTYGGGDESIGFYSNIDGFDATFENDSFDFLDVAIQCDVNCRFSKIDLVNNHLEHLRRGIAERLGSSNNAQDLIIKDSKYVSSFTFYYIASAAIASGGTGYNLGDTVTITGGGVLIVSGVSGSTVTAATVRTGGEYATVPSNPVAQTATSGLGSGATFNLTMLYGNGRPNMSLIRGKWNVNLDGLILNYPLSSHAADNAMFLIDQNANVVQDRNVRFQDFSFTQMIASQTLLNDDPYFSNGTLGVDVTQDMGIGWTVPPGGSSNITAQTDNTQVWSSAGATQALEFTCTGGSNFYVIRTDRFPVTAGDRLIADTAFYGGTSTGTVSIALRYLYFAGNFNLTNGQGNDGAPFGDTMANIYGDTNDPAYTGNRLYWAKMNFLRLATVPVGADSAELEVTVSNMNSGDVVWLGFAGVDKL